MTSYHRNEDGTWTEHADDRYSVTRYTVARKTNGEPVERTWGPAYNLHQIYDGVTSQRTGDYPSADAAQLAADQLNEDYCHALATAYEPRRLVEGGATHSRTSVVAETLREDPLSGGISAQLITWDQAVRLARWANRTQPCWNTDQKVYNDVIWDR